MASWPVPRCHEKRYHHINVQFGQPLVPRSDTTTQALDQPASSAIASIRIWKTKRQYQVSLRVDIPSPTQGLHCLPPTPRIHYPFRLISTLIIMPFLVNSHFPSHTNPQVSHTAHNNSILMLAFLLMHSCLSSITHTNLYSLYSLACTLLFVIVVFPLNRSFVAFSFF